LPHKTYAISLNIIFMSSLYFSGLPILLYFALIGFINLYLIEKFLLVKYYSKS